VPRRRLRATAPSTPAPVARSLLFKMSKSLRCNCSNHATQDSIPPSARAPGAAQGVATAFISTWKTWRLEEWHCVRATRHRCLQVLCNALLQIAHYAPMRLLRNSTFNAAISPFCRSTVSSARRNSSLSRSAACDQYAAVSACCACVETASDTARTS
jgi:hypothetical protein